MGFLTICALPVCTANDVPKNRETAVGTKFEDAWKTPDTWPRDVRHASMDELDFGIRRSSNELFWRGRPLEFWQKVTLDKVQFVAACVGIAFGALAALWPIGVAYGLWGTCWALIPTLSRPEPNRGSLAGD